MRISDWSSDVCSSDLGEREQARYNKSLAKFDLTGIDAAPRGMPQVEVSFDIDANGIVHVTAKDKKTGKEQKVEIKAGSGLSDDEIQRMVNDAETHREEDKKFQELVTASHPADALNNGEPSATQDTGRPETVRVGQEGVRTCRFRG